MGTKHKGYLYTKGEDYFEFCPYPNCRLDKYEVTVLPSFDMAVAEYFAKYKKNAHEEE